MLKLIGFRQVVSKHIFIMPNLKRVINIAMMIVCMGKYAVDSSTDRSNFGNWGFFYVDPTAKVTTAIQ